ncbi:hypothetical protein ACJMK2_004955 [Sinanodonta woodiana]
MADFPFPTIKKECLAIVWAVETLHYYLCGASFSVETDHNPLTWLSQNKGKNQRLLRWYLCLQPYEFTIKHRRGVKNTNADGLSRAGI